MRPGIRATLMLILSSTAVGAVENGSLDQFRCMILGAWDNVGQAQNDAKRELDPQNRHPRRAMLYIPVANPDTPGQLFAILNYTEAGFDGPVERVSLHRFRQADDGATILHEFLFLESPHRESRAQAAAVAMRLGCASDD